VLQRREGAKSYHFPMLFLTCAYTRRLRRHYTWRTFCVLLLTLPFSTRCHCGMLHSITDSCDTTHFGAYVPAWCGISPGVTLFLPVRYTALTLVALFGTTILCASVVDVVVLAGPCALQRLYTVTNFAAVGIDVPACVLFTETY